MSEHTKNKIHFNPKTGTVSICRAEKGNCPFNDPEDTNGGHYSNPEDMDAYIERRSKSEESSALEGAETLSELAHKNILETMKKRKVDTEKLLSSISKRNRIWGDKDNDRIRSFIEKGGELSREDLDLVSSALKTSPERLFYSKPTFKTLKPEDLPETLTPEIVGPLLERYFIREEEVSFISRTGSNIYGLEQEDSDFDFTMILNRENFSNKQYISDDRLYDCSIYNYKNFSKAFFEGAPNIVDIVHSGAGKFIRENSTAPYLRNMRYNSYTYQVKAEAMILNNLKMRSKELEKEDPRERKSLKLSKNILRTSIVTERNRQNSLDYRVAFTPEEKEQFFEKLPEFNSFLEDRLSRPNREIDKVLLEEINYWIKREGLA